MGKRVKITVTQSRCRCGYCKAGDEFIVEDLCPPVCHELWNVIYPMVYVLQNGGSLDRDDGRDTSFSAACPDGGRVTVRGETMD